MAGVRGVHTSYNIEDALHIYTNMNEDIFYAYHDENECVRCCYIAAKIFLSRTIPAVHNQSHVCLQHSKQYSAITDCSVYFVHCHHMRRAITQTEMFGIILWLSRQFEI